MTREEYMNYRAIIDNALKSSLFAIQSMFCDAACESFNVHITKKDVNDKPAEIDRNDVEFLQYRFADHELDAGLIAFHDFNAVPHSLVSFNILAT